MKGGKWLKMASNIISVSIPQELAEFLNNNEDISPSKVLQTKLYEMKDDEVRFKVRLKALEIRNGALLGKIEKTLSYLEEKYPEVRKAIDDENVLV